MLVLCAGWMSVIGGKFHYTFFFIQPLFTIATFIFNSFINGQRFSQQFLLEISLWKLLLRAKNLTDLFSIFEIIIS